MTHTYIHAFRRAAGQRPGQTALFHNGVSVTYAQLDEMSDRIARALKAEGRKSAVPVLLERGIDAVAAMLGVWKAGAALCIVSTEYPEERIQAIRRECGADFLLDRAWMHTLGNATNDAFSLTNAAPPEAPGLIVFTSGSTGRPKGVVLPHRAVSMAVNGNRHFFTESDVYLSLASFSFIAVVLEILTPLVSGVPVHIAGDALRRDVPAIIRYIREHGISSAFLPPQSAAQFLALADGKLRMLLTGSERVRNLWSAKTRITALYGASETCGPTAYFSVDKPYENTSLGEAYEGSRILLLDDHGEPVPQGEEGEICVTGQIALGYLNQPELTAERFVPVPHARHEDSAMMFCSGDLGRINADGTLEYVQRKDWMLKIRGYRVEPGEIEEVMLREAPIEKAVAIGFENRTGFDAAGPDEPLTRLYACYTAKGDVPPETVLAAIRPFLPEYMLPAFLEQVPKLPLNANGKIDRTQIAPPEIERYKTEYVAPENESEAEICAAFAAVLGLERVGVFDDFILLGGDSVSAVKVQTLVPHLGLTVSSLLSARTPRSLAETAGTNPVAAPLAKAGPRDIWPLTFAERQMVIEQSLEPESVAYNVNLAYGLSGPLDEARLEKALDALVRRHRVLRSFYLMEQGELIRKIAEHRPVILVKEICPAAEIETRIKSRNKPFDLARAPLCRFALFDTGEGEKVLHLVLHHCIVDGLSGGILLNELRLLYLDADTLPGVVEEPDYLDYALWQERHADASPHERFFLDMFADGVPENDMPSRPLRPERLPFANATLSVTLDAAPVDALAKSLAVTPYAVLFSAVSLMLGRYCGSEDVVLGAAMNGRSLPETGRMVGMFVNSLPVRLKPEAPLSLHAYIRDTARLLSQVQEHQTCPFERLVPLLAPDRNASRAPIFDVLVNYLEDPALPDMDGVSISRLPFRNQELAMDLVLEAMRRGRELTLELSYCPELYLDDVAAGMLELLSAILFRMASGSDIPLADATELTGRQRQELLEDFAGTRNDDMLGKTVVELFREQARKTPDNTALASGGATFSYEDLDLLTDRLAVLLRDKGVGRGATVGILVNRGPMMVVGALGALKAGAAHVPLDPSYPSERLAFMLADAGAALLIADDDLRGLLPGYKGAFLPSGEALALRNGPAPGDLPEPPLPGDLFVLLYTSGTTGKPKGVMLRHANLANFCGWFARNYGLTDTDAVAAYASFGFDACLMDLYPALSNGASVHIIPEEMRLDLPRLNDYFNENRITVAFMTTQLGRQFAESMPNTSLRALSLGGESLVPIKPPTGYALYNAYGPTECTVFISLFRVDRLYDRVPLGKTLDNTCLYILDKHDRLAPMGTAGELCIAGRQVADGYLNRPDLTAEKFTPNPFSADPEYNRMYRTGDVARWLPGGLIDFVGRRDFQVKIRGFRVELTEIEGRIRLFPGIADAAVIPADAPGGGKCAVAYVVGAEAGERIDVDALNRFIEEQLPPYMVPAATMQVERIPLNPNGKVDRRKLPAPVYQEGKTDTPEQPSGPRTELERTIMEELAEILGHKQFGPSSNLLRMGLTSLSAIKLAAGLDARLGTAPAVRDMMQNPTAVGIADALIRMLLKQGGRKPDKNDIDEDREAWPLSQSQAGVCFDCMKRPDTLAYNIPVRLTMTDAIDAERLARAAASIINAHPVLKVRLLMDGERIMQTPGKDPAVVPHLTVNERELEDLATSFVRPFVLFEGPLYRAQVLSSPGKVTLLVDFHHIVFDGGSLDIFLRQMGEAYGNGELPAESREKITAFAWAAREERREGSREWLEDKAYFNEMLAECEGASELPGDLPHSAEPGPLKEAVRTVDKETVDRFCREHGVTPAALFLAAVAYAVGRWTYGSTVYLSTISSGRSDPGLRNSFGMFVRTLPLAVSLGSGRSALEYVHAAQDALSGAVRHEGYPFTRIAEDLGYEPAIVYACQLGVTAEYGIGGQKPHMEPLAPAETKFKISVHIEERDGAPAFAVQYDSAHYSAGLMERFAATLRTALEHITAAPDSPVRSLSLLFAGERERLDSFNNTQGDVTEQVLHRMFEAEVRDNPDRVALIAQEGAYTYAELNAEANRLANALLGLGVKAEDRVAFVLHRTGRVLVAMLGALKAGCAYIPVDPEYPEERIAHVLEDSAAAYLLTTADLLERFSGLSGVLDIDAVRQEQSPENPDVDVRPEHLAYLIYTSGSTGKPKGVMIEHKGIANYVTAHPLNRHVHALVTDARIMMSITTVAFDMFLKEGMTSLCNGLTLVFADDEDARDPVRMAALFERTGADAFNTTPSRMLEYTEYPPLLEAVRRCRVIMAGAEKYPEALLMRLRGGPGSKARLFNTYGPTEITVSCNGKELTGADRVTIGAPLLNVREFVVDSDGNPLPVGMVGELWVGGRGVARGYINLPEQTAERFVKFNGERVYKTGDFARWTADGEIEILGRNDNQIKLRGLRVEIGEIENTLASLPGLRACAVAIRRLNNADHLCAYYVADAPLDPAALRGELGKGLAPYMVPTAYLQIEAMPKTPNGKNDLRALPDPEPLRLSEYEAPAGEMEEIFCAIFAKILNLEQVGAQDSFFDIGGSSLAVTRIIIEAKERGVLGRDGASVTYGDVFANPTPRELAALLDGGGSGVTPPEKGEAYDYGLIDEILQSGSLEAFKNGSRRPIGNVFLTGATGFLGTHVLHALLRQEDSAVYCLLRRGRYDSVETRLKHILFYYFEDSCEDLIGSRLFALEGDLTDKKCMERLQAAPIDTIINCAANVTHFAKGTGIADVNTGGVLNLVDFALEKNARLIQISTTSVAGFSVDGQPPRGTDMDEHMLFFGQNLENQYVHSKFMAERAVLEAVPRGLDAKIMRVGNLMARNRDGEFQINSRANSFIGRLRAYEAIGCFPYSSYSQRTELAPIDSTARAILLLASAPEECRVFHPYNNHMLFMGDIIATMRDEGISIDMVEDEVFEQALSAAMKDKARAEQLVSLIAYQNVAQGRVAVPVGSDNEYTTQTLLRMGWRWPETSGDYLRKFMQGLIGLGFFRMDGSGS